MKIILILGGMTPSNEIPPSLENEAGKMLDSVNLIFKLWDIYLH
jgi:hypothetical protein